MIYKTLDYELFLLLMFFLYDYITEEIANFTYCNLKSQFISSIKQLAIMSLI